jgi:hypothetical protein
MVDPPRVLDVLVRVLEHLLVHLSIKSARGVGKVPFELLRRVVPVDPVAQLLVRDGDAQALDLLCHEALIHERLPCLVAQLLGRLLVGFLTRLRLGVVAHVLQQVGEFPVGDLAAVDRADVILRASLETQVVHAPVEHDRDQEDDKQSKENHWHAVAHARHDRHTGEKPPQSDNVAFRDVQKKDNRNVPQKQRFSR